MNLDRILGTCNQQGVSYLLIGGMNFLLRHQPVLTYDVDLWIEDTPENRRRCESALAALDAEWGRTNADWGPVAAKPAGWLDQQAVYCLNSPHGAIDVFRSLKGPTDWQTSWNASVVEQTAAGTSYHGLSDADMLACQLALDAGAQKAERIRVLRSKLKSSP